jgi:predicted dehydrogenase
MNFLIIGFGSVGSRHAQNLVEIGISCTVIEPNIYKLQNAIKEGFIGYKTLNEIDGNHNFDAVLVCSPPSFHIEQTIWALEKGKKVFLEKPIGLDLNECSRLLKYDQSKIFVGYTYRWNPQFQKLKETIGNNLIGKPYYANFIIGMNLEDWHPWENYNDFFMSSKELGGGALLDESHFLELIIELFGLPEKISGMQSKISSLEIEVDDYVSAQFYYEKLLVDVKLDIFKRPHESFIEVYGSVGSVSCDFVRKINILTTSKSYAISDSNLKRFKYERNEIFKNMMSDFITFVHSETETPRVSFSRGMEVMLIIDKIREASLKRNWVNIDKD